MRHCHICTGPGLTRCHIRTGTRLRLEPPQPEPVGRLGKRRRAFAVQFLGGIDNRENVGGAGCLGLLTESILLQYCRRRRLRLRVLRVGVVALPGFFFGVSIRWRVTDIDCGYCRTLGTM